MGKKVVKLFFLMALWISGVQDDAVHADAPNRWLIVAVNDLSFKALQQLADESERWRELFDQGALASMTLRTLDGRGEEALNWTIAGGMRNARLESVHLTWVGCPTDHPAALENVSGAWDDGVCGRERLCLTAGRPRLDLVTFGDVLSDIGASTAYVSFEQDPALPVIWLMGHKRCMNVYHSAFLDAIPPVDVLLITARAKTDTWLNQAEDIALRIVRARQAGQEVMLLGTTPIAEEGHAAPLFWWRPNGEGQGGTLRSSTTRWPGIVAAVDLLPTWLVSFQALPSWEKLADRLPYTPYLEGAEIETISSDVSSRLTRLERLFILHRVRPAVLNGYLKVTTLALVFSVIYRLLPRSFHSFVLSRLMRFLIVFALVGPGSLLFLGALWQAGLCGMAHWQTPAPYIGWMFLSALLFFLLWQRIGTYGAFFTYSLIVFLFLIANQFQDDAWIRYSVFGYDPFVGARYYGIGNELMGYVSGLGMLLIGLLKRQRLHPFIPWTVYGLILVYLAAPFLGSNVGGTLAWLMLLPYVAFKPALMKGEAVQRSRRLRPFFIRGSLLIGGMLVFLFFFVVWHGRFETAPTHLTRLIDRLWADGWAPFWEVALRKWQMNWKLVRYSTYSMVFLVSFLISMVYRLWLYRHKKLYHTVFDGVLGVSLVNFFVNDSGVVAAAMGLLFFVFPLFVCRHP